MHNLFMVDKEKRRKALGEEGPLQDSPSSLVYCSRLVLGYLISNLIKYFYVFLINIPCTLSQQVYLYGPMLYKKRKRNRERERGKKRKE